MLNLKKVSFRNFDWKLFVPVLFLVSMGLAAIYSVDLSRGTELIFFKKQVVALLLGLALLLVISWTQPSLWRNLSKWWYLFSVILLIGVLIFGESIRGTKGWFSLFGYSFQPVELAKVGIILILAYIISKFGRRFERPLFFFGTAIIAFVPTILVMAQPDLGSAILLGVIWFGLMWLVETRRLFFLSFILVMIIISMLGWSFLLKDYQKERLVTFVNPRQDPLGSGYNLTQSIIAVGAGKLYGRGLGFGSQSQLKFLPEAQTDFIFSVIGEELGLAGVVTMLVLFAIIFWRLLVLIKKTDDDFAAIFASGVLILLFSQFVINISACIGLLPITGVTLPFVSYGGSSLINSLMLIGIVQSMIGKG